MCLEEEFNILNEGLKGWEEKLPEKIFCSAALAVSALLLCAITDC